MAHRLLSGGLLMLLLTCACAQEDAPDARIAYAPDVVGVERLFMVALRAPVGTGEIAVTAPASVELLDHTAFPARAEVSRFYFRSLAPDERAEIRFAHPDGEIVVPVVIWSLDELRDLRTLKDIQLPRRWPLGESLPELKQGRTITSEAEIAALEGRPGGAERWLETPDEDIWAMQPDSTIPRWHWVNIQEGCPVHGREIYTGRAYYPWVKDATFPWRWKIGCPVGNEEYPSNDFGAGDFTSGAFPDDGIGGGHVRGGRHYGFIAELSQFYAHQMLRVAPECARGYIATGDIRYVHKALVALSRLAVEYAYLATMTQHRHRNTVAQVERFGQGRFDEGPILGSTGLTVYSIDQPRYQVVHAEAYDRIWPAIDEATDVIPFLQGKGIDVRTGEDVRRFIEENLMATWMQAAMDGATHSNEPHHQWGLAKMAEMLNYERGTDFMDWLYDGAGRMRVFVPNGYFRDGAPYESTGGYNSMHVTPVPPIVQAVLNQQARRPEVYPEEKYPPLHKSRRYRHIFDFEMDSVTIDRSYPYVGDTGGFPAFSRLPKITWQAAGAQVFEHAYELFRDPKFAWALANARGWQPSVGFPFTREEIEQEAAKWPDDWNDHSRLHDGYGLAILRGGKGDDKRALWLRYGISRGHNQDDMLDIGLQGFEGILLQHMGYPRNWGYWEYSWTSHNVARQFPYVWMTGQAELLADGGAAQVSEARAQGYIDRVDAGQGYELPEDSWQRRTLALVDVGPDQFYGVDLYRISGGDEQWWAFHAHEGEFSTAGIDLTPQEGGTLAGPEVPYGDADWLRANGCSLGGYGWRGPRFGFAHLYNVERGRHERPWHADWAIKNGEGLHLRLHVAAAEGMDVAVCDGTSPAGGNPYEMKWLMLSRMGTAPLRTQVLSLVEAYMGEPAIEAVEPLAVSGEDEAGFAAAGCLVRLADATDTVVVSADPSVRRVAANGLAFAGRFGLYREQDGVPVAMTLVGGTQLEKDGFGIRLDSPEYRASITQVDRATETITVSPAPPNPQALVGEHVFITNPVRRSGYRVQAARAVPGGAEIQLDLDSRIGIGRATGAQDFRITTDTPFPLHRNRYYHGARVIGPGGGEGLRIIEARSGNAVFIDPEGHPDADADHLGGQFPADTWFEVYDYGVGDELVFPYTVSVTLVRPGVYDVKSQAPVSLTLPEGTGTEGGEG